MAHKQKGLTVRPNVWWRHLGNYFGRHFWKRQRQADKKEIDEQNYKVYPVCGLCFSNHI